MISLAKETGLSTSKVGRQLHEKDLDEVMKEVGRFCNLTTVASHRVSE